MSSVRVLMPPQQTEFPFGQLVAFPVAKKKRTRRVQCPGYACPQMAEMVRLFRCAVEVLKETGHAEVFLERARFLSTRPNSD